VGDLVAPDGGSFLEDGAVGRPPLDAGKDVADLQPGSGHPVGRQGLLLGDRTRHDRVGGAQRRPGRRDQAHRPVDQPGADVLPVEDGLLQQPGLVRRQVDEGEVRGRGPGPEDRGPGVVAEVRRGRVLAVAGQDDQRATADEQQLAAVRPPATHPQLSQDDRLGGGAHDAQPVAGEHDQPAVPQLSQVRLVDALLLEVGAGRAGADGAIGAASAVGDGCPGG
jgi:hypothetical protein